MPFFIVFGGLSDRIGRKKIMMAGCLLAAISYLPIYHAMQSAAGSNVVTARSQRNAVTGAITLTPLSEVDGELQPAKEVLPFTGFAALISEAGRVEAHRPDVHPGDFCDDGLWSDSGLSGGSVSGEDPIHRAFASLSHRQWRLRRPAAADRIIGYCARPGTSMPDFTIRLVSQPSRLWLARCC